MDSRRHCEGVIVAGRVCVNGKVVVELGTTVDPSRDVVTVDGAVVSLGSQPVTIMINKPRGCLTSMSDPQGRFCIGQMEPF